MDRIRRVILCASTLTVALAGAVCADDPEKADVPGQEMIDLPTDTEMRDLPLGEKMINMPTDTEMRDAPGGEKMKDLPTDTEMKDLPSDTKMKDAPEQGPK